MNKPRRPRLPPIAADPPPPHKPDPRFHPDERKEGGPDFGKENRQREKARQGGADSTAGAQDEPPG